MSRKHRRILESVFRKPEPANLKWDDVEKLFKSLGAVVSEREGSRVAIFLNGRIAVFHRPHPRKETDKGAVKSVRKFLENAGGETMMKYKGYTAVVEFDDEAEVFCGEVADTMDVITFQSENAKELEKEFHKSVDEYLKFCAEMKRIPEKPFSGKLLLRLSPSLHRKLYIDAVDKGESLNHHITEMLQQA